jgi:hypothetical protein
MAFVPRYVVRYRENKEDRILPGFHEPSEPTQIGRRMARAGASRVAVEDEETGQVIWQSSSMRPNPEDDTEAARQIRETFVDRPAEKTIEVGWKWPRTMRHVGICLGVMYSSDKWQPKRGQQIDYKHVAEGPQDFYVVPGFLRDYEADTTGSVPLRVYGPEVTLNGRMPTAIAVLADLIGLQVSLHEPAGKGGFSVPNPPESNAFQIDVDRATLGAGKHPETGETFLVIYDRHRLLAMVTGDILHIEKDGITG